MLLRVSGLITVRILYGTDGSKAGHLALTGRFESEDCVNIRDFQTRMSKDSEVDYQHQ